MERTSAEYDSGQAAQNDAIPPRLPQEVTPGNAADMQAQNRHLADELSTITGAGPSSRLSIEPSAVTPGRVRVKLDEIDLDPVSVVQLYAAVSKVLLTKPTPRQ